MKHFAKIVNLNNAKNKAHQEIQAYAISRDNTLLYSDEARQQYIADFRNKIAKTNLTFPRCHDIDLSGWDHFTVSKEDRTIGVHGNFYMLIYPVKHELNSN